MVFILRLGRIKQSLDFQTLFIRIHPRKSTLHQIKDRILLPNQMKICDNRMKYQIYYTMFNGIIV